MQVIPVDWQHKTANIDKISVISALLFFEVGYILSAPIV